MPRDPTARRLYKDHLSYMLGRTNTLTGQRYASDPAVYGYDVLNEPRCALAFVWVAWLLGVPVLACGLLRASGLCCQRRNSPLSPPLTPTCSCPGCDPSALADHVSWLREMGSFVESTVSSDIMVLAGTEGFFTPQASGGRGGCAHGPFGAAA